MSKFLRYPELVEKYGIPWCVDHLRAVEKAGGFPKRIKLGDRPQSAVVWIESEVQAWAAERAASRKPEAA